MIFKEIGLSEALRIIGEGNLENDLYFYRVGDIYPNLSNYSGYDVNAKQIKSHRWFVRIEEEVE